MFAVCFSILMTWIYMKTNGNLLCMMLFHLGINIGVVMLLQNREGTFIYGLLTIIGALVCIPIVLKNKNEFFNKGFKKATPTIQFAKRIVAKVKL